MNNGTTEHRTPGKQAPTTEKKRTTKKKSAKCAWWKLNKRWKAASEWNNWNFTSIWDNLRRFFFSPASSFYSLFYSHCSVRLFVVWFFFVAVTTWHPSEIAINFTVITQENWLFHVWWSSLFDFVNTRISTRKCLLSFPLVFMANIGLLSWKFIALFFVCFLYMGFTSMASGERSKHRFKLKYSQVDFSDRVWKQITFAYAIFCVHSSCLLVNSLWHLSARSVGWSVGIHNSACVVFRLIVVLEIVFDRQLMAMRKRSTDTHTQSI